MSARFRPLFSAAGYMTIERLVAFSGSAINLQFTLQRKN